MEVEFKYAQSSHGQKYAVPQSAPEVAEWGDAAASLPTLVLRFFVGQSFHFIFQTPTLLLRFLSRTCWDLLGFGLPNDR